MVVYTVRLFRHVATALWFALSVLVLPGLLVAAPAPLAPHDAAPRTAIAAGVAASVPTAPPCHGAHHATDRTCCVGFGCGSLVSLPASSGPALYRNTDHAGFGQIDVRLPAGLGGMPDLPPPRA